MKSTKCNFNLEMTNFLTYCGRIETHEIFVGWRKYDIDTEIEFGKVGQQVDLGHMDNGVQLPGNVSIWKLLMIIAGCMAPHSFSFEMDAKGSGWRTGIW